MTRVQRVTDSEAREKYGITGVTNDMSGIVFQAATVQRRKSACPGWAPPGFMCSPRGCGKVPNESRFSGCSLAADTGTLGTIGEHWEQAVFMRVRAFPTLIQQLGTLGTDYRFQGPSLRC